MGTTGIVFSLKFLDWRQSERARLVAFELLMRAGDVHPHPGPDFCPICGGVSLSRTFKCTGCHLWVHRKCIDGHRECVDLRRWVRPKDFKCANCKAKAMVQNKGMDPRAVTMTNELVMLQFNCNGVSGKADELGAYLVARGVHVATIQESKLNGPPPNFEGYSAFWVNRGGENRGGGLLTLVDEALTANLIDAPPNGNAQVEQLLVRVTLPTGKSLTVANCYVPPSSSMADPAVSMANILNLPGDVIVMGDWNAHSRLWDDNSAEDVRGRDLADEVDMSEMIILNDPRSPTRLPVNGAALSPDVSLASPAVAPFANWVTEVALSSDHLPILISLRLAAPLVLHKRRMYVNFRKADWRRFREEVDKVVMKLPPPPSAAKGERILRRVLIDATVRHIPCGRHHPTTPMWPAEIRDLVLQRDALRAADPSSPRIAELNGTISRKLAKLKSDKWAECMESCSIGTDSTRYWRIIKSLNGGSAVRNTAVDFGRGQISRPLHLAENFNHMFGTVVPNHVNKEDKKATRNLVLSRRLGDAPVFTADMVKEAIKAMRASKAEGPDGLTILQFKHLGRYALAYLTRIFNLSVERCDIPGIWKSSCIVPLPKPGKDPAMGSSYRPVSLLCPAVKVLEKLLLPHLKEHLPLANHQHGFRKGHSTTSALMKIITAAGDGFNRKLPPDRTLVVALDLSKAFDSLDHSILIRKVANTTLPNALVRWLANYLLGRQIRTMFRGVKSGSRIMKVGSPQGSIISPHLFNFYVAGLPVPEPPLQMVSYADDITVFGAGDRLLVQRLMNRYLPVLKEALDGLHLSLSPAKSSATLLTKETKQIRDMERLVRVFVDGARVPVERNPKILGVTLDPQLHFNKHAERVGERVRRNTNILKALTSASRGQQKESLVATYKATGRAIMDYAAPVYMPCVPASHIRRLQTAQNGALRVALGCHKMAAEDHLHQEAKMLKVEEHGELLSAQWLATCYNPVHPCHELSRPRDRATFPRNVFKSLGSGLRPVVEANLVFDPGGQPNCRATQKALHTRQVGLAIASRRDNVVLGARPPNVSHRERRLPRGTRRTLSQLRSGYSVFTNSYRSRISNVPDVCPNCQGTPHDPVHLFNCPARRTALSVIDMWRRPQPAARFLNI